MTGDDLAAWARRCGYRGDAQAASAVGLSVAQYRRQRTGRSRVSRQTAIIAAFREIDVDRIFQIADAAARLARATGARPSTR